MRGMITLPQSSVRGTRHLVAAADQLASRAGDLVLDRGGNAVDAAIATNAAIAVTGPHLCGMGGDLFALVHDGSTAWWRLNASGRAGIGRRRLTQLRDEGHVDDAVPSRHPHGHGARLRRRLARAARSIRFDAARPRSLAPAIDLADGGFAASPLLAGCGAPARRARRRAARRARPARRPARERSCGVTGSAARVAGDRRSRPRRASTAASSATACSRIGAGYFTPDDLGAVQAEWVEPLGARMFGVDVHTIGPNSQGYLTLGGGIVADRLDAARRPRRRPSGRTC